MESDGIWNGLCIQLHFVALPVAETGVRARVLRGAACSPSDSGKTIIFRANAKFFGQKPAAKTEEKDLFVKRKTEFILFSEMKTLHQLGYMCIKAALNSTQTHILLGRSMLFRLQNIMYNLLLAKWRKLVHFCLATIFIPSYLYCLH